jgi:uncharacterized protein (UPF0305 family)
VLQFGSTESSYREKRVETMAVMLENRVTDLEQLMAQLTQSVDRLSREMQDFKDEMREFNNESRRRWGEFHFVFIRQVPHFSYLIFILPAVAGNKRQGCGV